MPKSWSKSKENAYEIFYLNWKKMDYAMRDSDFSFTFSVFLDGEISEEQDRQIIAL